MHSKHIRTLFLPVNLGCRRTKKKKKKKLPNGYAVESIHRLLKLKEEMRLGEQVLCPELLYWLDMVDGY